MKNMTLALGIIWMFTVGAYAQKATKYTIKSGHIEYKLTGNTTGTKSVWFDDYGDKSFVRTKAKSVTKMFGVTNESTENNIVIMNGSIVYNIDMATLSGTKMENDFYGLSEALVSKMSDAERKQFGKDLLNNMGGEIVGTEKILGKTCEVVKLMNIKVWIYEGVTLKSEGKIMGIEANETAVKFEENIQIPAVKFEPPKEVIIEDVTQMTNDLMSGDYDENGEYIGQTIPSGNEEESDITPVNYPFEEFKKVVLGFNPEGYTRGMILNQEGQHFALYMKSMGEMVTVLATASENIESQESEFVGFEEFTHHGRTMRYGILEEDGKASDALLIKYNNHDMYIILMSLPAIDKNTLLSWSDNLEF
ncbi:MAG: hypothetical protein Q8O72_01520 [Bacteroidales bacterium]|nr:hypothetical protein [Bacteroidales bacterium]